MPAGGGAEEVPVGGADVGFGGYAGAAAQDDLRGHELAVVLAERAGEGLIAGVAGVGGLGPLPDVAVELLGGGGGGAAYLGVEVVGFEEVAGDEGCWAAMNSHSNSVGRRLPDQRAKASASKKLTWQTGVSEISPSGRKPLRVKMLQPELVAGSRVQ